jgi:ATP-dependent helicase/DNAse subunit B
VSSTIFNGLDTPKDEGGIGRNYESFSSLDMLIQNPFDYVLQYVFKCNETSRTNLSAVKGNVVHKMFNNAVLESDNDWTKLKAALVDNFDENFDKAVNEVGIELLSLNNRLTYNLFKNVIKTCSIPSFINIIEDNDLSIVGSEEDIMVDFEKIGKFNAKIDMVLKNPEGKYVIMDFKWTDGKDKKREGEIKNNMEMQLALYAQAVRQHFGEGDESSVEAIGYFMLRQGVFITEYQGLKKSKLPDKWIPALLGIIGVTLAAVWILATGEISNYKELAAAFFTAVTQGVLVAGASVYAKQLYIQAKKQEEA